MPFDGTEAKFVKPEVFSLEGLVAWLETMPPEQTYCYIDVGACLMHQYLSAAGLPVLSVSPWDWTDRAYSTHAYPYEMNLVAIERPRTFGAALTRARAVGAPKPVAARRWFQLWRTTATA